MIGRSGVPIGWRGLVSLVVSAVLCLGLASCAQRTSVRDTFGDEKLMTQDYPGLVVVYEDWTNGVKGGWSAFSTAARAARHFEAASQIELEAGFEELTAVAVAEGWVEDTPGDLPFFFRAYKEFPAGQASLSISIATADDAEIILLFMTLNN